MLKARHDPLLLAQVIRRVPLRYSAAVPGLPGHVRSGSSAVLEGRHLMVIQDDVNAVARVNLDTWLVDAVLLPADVLGRRVFGEADGTKAHKMDLECALLVHGTLVALGSGSTPARERVVMVDRLSSSRPGVEVAAAHGLYAALRAEKRFSGSELNVEGAALLGTRVRLFNRGNGAPKEGLHPVNAFCDVESSALLGHVRGGAAPALRDVTPCDLGMLERAPLGFTGAANLGSTAYFVTAAEDSPDAYHDGEVTGSVMGVMDGETLRWTPFVLPDGSRWTAKVEGVELDPANPGRAYVTVDADNPDEPATLAVVELRGPW